MYRGTVHVAMSRHRSAATPPPPSPVLWRQGQVGSPSRPCAPALAGGGGSGCGGLHFIRLELHALANEPDECGQQGGLRLLARLHRRRPAGTPRRRHHTPGAAAESPRRAGVIAVARGDAEGHQLEELSAQGFKEDGRARRDAQVDPRVDQHLVLCMKHLRLGAEEDEVERGDAGDVVDEHLARRHLLVVDEPAGVEALGPVVERRRVDRDGLLMLVQL
mmetsp:Transcript_15474/g.39939  ORF Transcript_15474/g.39939 Transcript_15474/m.39939 type:complete len:219 (-) Transcript_15474:289-945(-)